MFKHYCDICGKELIGKAKRLEITETDIPCYITDIVTTPSVESYSCVTLDCTSRKIGCTHEICEECANKIENKCQGGEE